MTDIITADHDQSGNLNPDLKYRPFVDIANYHSTCTCIYQLHHAVSIQQSTEVKTCKIHDPCYRLQRMQYMINLTIFSVPVCTSLHDESK